MRKIFPGCAARAVVLADRSPLPFGEIRSPALPVLLSDARFFEPAVFRGLYSWTDWVALGQNFHAIDALFLDDSSADLAAGACFGKARRRSNAPLNRGLENAF